MKKEIILILNNYSTGTSIIEQKTKDYSLTIKQKGIVLTPKQYEKVHKKIKAIKKIVTNEC